MEAFWQFLMEISARHITPYGLYIPGEPYRFFLWNELLVILLSFSMTILWLRNRALKRRLEMEKARANSLARQPFHPMRGSSCQGRHVDLEAVRKIIQDHDLVRMTYIDFKGNVTERTVEVYQLFQHDGRWYIEGFCWLRCEERSFRADRIVDISPAIEDTDEQPLPEYQGEDCVSEEPSPPRSPSPIEN